MTVTNRPDLLFTTAAELTATDGSQYGEGALAYAQDTNQAYRYSGSAWVTEADVDTHIADTEDAHTEITTLNTYIPRFSTLTADSADIQNDTFTETGLSVTLPIAGTYVVEAVLPYTTPSAQDIQFKFVAGTATITATAGTSDIWMVDAIAATGTTTSRVPVLVATSWTTAVSVLSDQAIADINPVVFKGKLVATVAGTVTIQFAQVTTGAFNTHIGAGAWFMAQRVA